MTENHFLWLINSLALIGLVSLGMANYGYYPEYATDIKTISFNLFMWVWGLGITYAIFKGLCK